MSKSLTGLLVVLVGCATLAPAQERFTDRLSAEERKAIGLELLSPEQMAALNALVQKDRQQGAGQIREQAKAELREEVKAQVKAEVKAQVKAEVTAQAKAEVQTEQQKLREAETRVLSRVLGKYSGWDGATQFKLENGQIWRQSEPGLFYTKPVENAAVLIEKVYGGWRLYDQSGGWVRVVRIK